MRKLSKKNKTYIAVFSFIFILLFGLVVGFILYKKNILDVKYDVPAGSYTYNSSGELIAINDSSIVKRDLIGRYYVENDEIKENLGYNAVIFEKDLDTVLLFGKFYDVKENGQVDIIEGFNKNNIYDTKFYKISDRKYLMIANKISSKDNAFSCSDYLLINIDKKGNGLLYNHNVNVKSFKNLILYTDKYNFNVNEELLIFNGETIYLNKINGSTNEYVAPKEEESSSGVYNNDEKVVTQKEIIEKYINRKTTIIDYEVTQNKAKFNYVIFDPLVEYSRVYYKLYYDQELIKEGNLNIDDSSFEVDSLNPSSSYKIEFYYDFIDDYGAVSSHRFDILEFRTKDIKAIITLEKITINEVLYKVKIEDGFILDSLNISLFADDEYIKSNQVNPLEAANSGAMGSFEKNIIGDYGILRLEDARYNGRSVMIDASYKFKI